jgi:hypothetical protein
MIFPACGAGIVGREKAGNAVAIVQLTKIGRTGDDVVASIVGISAEMITLTQLSPRLWHDLHQSSGALARIRVWTQLHQ